MRVAARAMAQQAGRLLGPRAPRRLRPAGPCVVQRAAGVRSEHPHDPWLPSRGAVGVPCQALCHEATHR
jgi:hypothetical protein